MPTSNITTTATTTTSSYYYYIIYILYLLHAPPCVHITYIMFSIIAIYIYIQGVIHNLTGFSFFFSPPFRISLYSSVEKWLFCFTRTTAKINTFHNNLMHIINRCDDIIYHTIIIIIIIVLTSSQAS